MAHKYNARKTKCWQGHTHDSKKEASRCDVLHDEQQRGKIRNLQVQPKFEFVINGAPVKMRNGQCARYTPDFQYFEDDKSIVEDSKGMVTADFRLRSAIFRHLFPHIELRVS